MKDYPIHPEDHHHGVAVGDGENATRIGGGLRKVVGRVADAAIREAMPDAAAADEAARAYADRSREGHDAVIERRIHGNPAPQALHLSEVPDDVLAEMAAAEMTPEAGEPAHAHPRIDPSARPPIDAPLSSHDPVDRWVMAHPGQPIAAPRPRTAQISQPRDTFAGDEDLRDCGPTSGARR